MSTQRDVEELLRNIPISTPEQVNQAQTTMQMFMSLANGALEGAGLPVRVSNPVGDAQNLVSQMQQGNYADAAVTLIGIVGTAAEAFGLLSEVAISSGAISGVGATASAGVVAGMVGEAAGPAGIAVAVLVATLRMPADVSENQRKLFFITDASGILTSWMFANPLISPHGVLRSRARTGGYFRVDISDACSLAHRQVDQLWRSHYRSNEQARRTARASARDDWRTYWRQVGAALNTRLRPFPSNAAAGWIESHIRAAERRITQAERTARQQQRQQRQREAQGGYYVRTPDGHELFMPNGL